MIGTIHIDEIIDLITDEEQRLASCQWQRGIISQKVVVKQLQMKENKDILTQVKGKVKLTRKVVIPPLDIISVSGLTNINKHYKRVNKVMETREDEDEFTVPCYSYMRPGSKKGCSGFMELVRKPQVLTKGTVVAEIQPTILNPSKLAPRLTNSNSNNGNKTPEPSPERIEKLFSKLNISGADNWSEENQLKLRQLFLELHRIFALDDLELGKTDMVKHVID